MLIGKIALPLFLVTLISPQEHKAQTVAIHSFQADSLFTLSRLGEVKKSPCITKFSPVLSSRSGKKLNTPMWAPPVTRSNPLSSVSLTADMT